MAIRPRNVASGSVWRALGLLVVLALVFLGPARLFATQQLSIKVAQYPRSFDFTCSQGGAWQLGGSQGLITPQNRCAVSGVLTAKAQLNYHVIIAEVPAAEADKLPELIAPWKAGGWEIRTISLGSVIANPDGTLQHDGRMLLASIGTYADQAEAATIVQQPGIKPPGSTRK